MKVAPEPFAELDYKAARRLIDAGYTSREQVLAAVQSGRLACGARDKPRQYGVIHHKRVLAWLGLPVTLPLLLGNAYRPPAFTPKQGQYLAFIYYSTKVNGRPPAEADFQLYFNVSPPTVHNMIVSLERAGLIGRLPGQARSISLRLPRNQLPDLA